MCVCLCLASVRAQTAVANNMQADVAVLGKVRGVVCDSIYGPLPGVLVTLHSKYNLNAEQLPEHTKTDGEGKFLLTFVLAEGNVAHIEIACAGYRIYKKILPGKEHIDLGKIYLQTDALQLDSIVVKGRLQLFKVKGNTIQYNTALLTVREGDTAGELIKQLPGMKVAGGVVTEHDRTIERTYVNGRELFGKDPSNAVEHLEARHIASIVTYDETDEQSAVELGEENARKRRVMNLLTFDLFEQSLNLDAVAGYGSDFDRMASGRRQERYLGGAGVKFFSERRQFKVDYLLNNINNQGSIFRPEEDRAIAQGYNRSNALDVEYGDKVGKWDVSGKYGFRDTYARRESGRTDTYFPDESNTPRHYADTSAAISRERTHSATLSARNKGKTLMIFAASGSLQEVESSDRNSSATAVDGDALNRYINRNSAAGNGYAANLLAMVMHRVKKHSVRFIGQADFAGSDGDGWRRDSSLVEQYGQIIANRNNGNSTEISGNIQYAYNIEKLGTISAMYIARNKSEYLQRMAIDTRTGDADPTLTRNYTNNYFGNEATVKLQKKLTKHSDIALQAAFTNKTFTKSDRFPENQNTRNTFNALLPGITYSYQNMEVCLFNASYSTSVQAPPSDMLMDKLDNANPLYLAAGNPGLKQSYTHTIGLSLTKNLSGSGTLDAEIVGKLSRNSIVARRDFFADSTFLTHYEYWAQPGSTLTTYRNAAGHKSLTATAGFSQYITSLKSTLNAGLNYNYLTSPMYVASLLSDSYTHRAGYDISLEGNLSEKISMGVSSHGAYNHTKTEAGDIDRAIQQYATTKIGWDFLKNFVFNTMYTLELYRSVDYAASRRTSHILNASLGYKLFRDRSGELTFMAWDILNRNNGFESTVMADHISDRWQVRSSRFFTINFSWKLRRLK